MLSQTTSHNMDQKPQSLHTRQQSSPAQFEVYQQLPQHFSAQQYDTLAHRRGISLDEQFSLQHQRMPFQSYQSMPHQRQQQEEALQYRAGNTNTGRHQPQHYTQVAQQQAQARPGQTEIYQPLTQEAMYPRLDVEQSQAFLQRASSQHQQRLDQERTTLLSEVQNRDYAAKMARSRSDQGPSLYSVPEHSSVLTASGLLAAFVPQQRNDSGRPSSATGVQGQHSGGWEQRIQRGTTPENKSSTCEHRLCSSYDGPPLTQHPTDKTPMTPHSPSVGSRPIVLAHRAVNSVSSEDMDIDATIKASRSPTRQPALSSIFEDDMSSETTHTSVIRDGYASQILSHAASNPNLRESHQPTHSHGSILISPPNTAPIKQSRHFDVASFTGSKIIPIGFAPLGQPTYRPHTPPQESPERTPMQAHFRGDVAPMAAFVKEENYSSPPYSNRSSVQYDGYSLPDEDMDPSRATIADLNLDAIVQETGISNEEVQSYISKPDQDGKWTCLFPGCNKVHGRKENVRAHVQTHLGDRQWQCVHCGKSFVRPHDLKRHSKVHSGVKPHPCACGRTFARHDALTRHKQRNICAGGLGGVVKKTAKRGRPRKQRPDGEERADKASKSRKRAVEARHDASSVSGTSASSQAGSSVPSSPASFSFDMADYQQTTGVAGQSSDFDFGSYNKADSDMLVQTPPMSPHSDDDWQSPSPNKAPSMTSGFSDWSSDRHESPELPRESSQPREQISESQYGSVMGSPPGLSHSSPLPSAPQSAKMPDFDFGSIFKNDPTEEATVNDRQHSQNFEEICYASSPEEVFAEPAYEGDSLFNFNEGSEPVNYSDSKFNVASFDEAMLFSDAADMNNDHFF